MWNWAMWKRATKANRREFLAGVAATSMVAAFPSMTKAARRPLLKVPAEHDPHALTFMQWPISRKVHSDPVFLGMLQQSIATVANAIVEFEPVVMLADGRLHGPISKRLDKRVELWDIPTEDLWARDSGPLFAKDQNGKLVVSHIQFNGWGNKQIHNKDGLIAQRVAERLNLDVVPAAVIGEAGGVEHNGDDLLIAHESSWVNDNRNPGLQRSIIGDRLKDAYGASRIIWSEGVYDEDITDYHIDSLVRFTDRRRAIINLPVTPDPDDPFHAAALETERTLRAAGLELEVIPEPEFRRVKSLGFVASYANFYVCNGAVIMAEFGDKETDSQAVDALQRHFPGREIVALNIDPIGEVGGGIHCATQQMPA